MAGWDIKLRKRAILCLVCNVIGIVSRNVNMQLLSSSQGGMIQASDLRSGRTETRGRPLSAAKKELHGYNGPMQYLQGGAGGNPDGAGDSMTTVQVTA